MLAFTVHVGRKVSEWDECIYKNKIKTAVSEHFGKNKDLGDTPQKQDPYLQSKMEMIPV